MLEDSYGGARKAAAETLGKLAPEVLTTHAATLATMLEDSDGDTRKAALEILGKLAPEVLATYATALAAKLWGARADRNVRAAAVETLGKLAPEVLAMHTIALVTKLEDADGDVRKAAVETLRKLTPEPEVLATHIASNLLDLDGNVPLGKFAPEVNATHAATLAAKLQDVDGDVRKAAVETLCNLTPEVLIAKLNGSDDKVHKAAVDILGKLAPEVLETHVAALVAKLNHSCEDVRKGAVDILGKLAPEVVSEAKAKLEEAEKAAARHRLAAAWGSGAAGSNPFAVTSAQAMLPTMPAAPAAFGAATNLSPLGFTDIG
eukprot:166427-Prymnesium_polylepis.1